MGQLEESLELTLDFTKLEKVGKQVAETRAAGNAPCDPGVIPVAVQNADTKEVILVAYTNEYAMRESFAKRKLPVVHEPQQAVVQGRDERRDVRSPRGVRELRAEFAPVRGASVPRRHLPYEEFRRAAAQLLLSAH